MSDLPNGWQSTTLGDLGNWKGGGTPSKHNSAFWNGDIPWVSPKDMKTPVISDTLDHVTSAAVEESSTNLVPANTLLVVNRSGILSHTFPVAITACEVALNQDIKALIPHPELNHNFIHGVLRAEGTNILNTCRKTGTTVASVEFSKLKEFEIGLPPFPEQERIVAKLESCESRITTAREALDELPALLEQYRQSILAAAFRGDLTKDWRAANPDTEPASELLNRLRKERRHRWEEATLRNYKTKGKEPPKKWREKYKVPLPISLDEAKSYPSVPSDWNWSNNEEISERVTVGHVGSMKNEYRDHGIAFLRGQNVRENRFDPKNLLKISDVFHEKLSKSKLAPGDIVVTRSGEVGTACVIPEALPIANCSDLVIIQSPIQIDSDYLSFYINSEGKRTVKEGTVGVAISHFNTKSVARMPIAIAPIEEQKEIARILRSLHRAIEKLRKSYNNSTSDFIDLNASMLSKAFAGQLIPQDPNDEHASILLERIKERRLLEQQIRAKRPKKKRPTTAKMSTPIPATIQQALEVEDSRLSTGELFEKMGHANDSKSETVEAFLIQLRDAISEGGISRVREDDEDYFSLKSA